MKIPKHIQFIAAGIVAAGLLYLGYSEISKINRRMKTLENNLEIVHQNLETVVRSSTNVLTQSTTNTPTKTNQVVFSDPVATDMTTKSVLEPEHIRVKKDEIERLEKQLENYDSENDITDSDEEYLSDESEYTVSSNDIEDEEVVEETTANTLNKEQNDILETTIDEILAHNATSETTVVSETNEDVVENNETEGDFSNLVLENGNVIDLSEEPILKSVTEETSETISADTLNHLLNYSGDELQEVLMKNTCVELRNILKQCNLSTVGKKQILINKIVNHINDKNKTENEVATN